MIQLSTWRVGGLRVELVDLRAPGLGARPELAFWVYALDPVTAGEVLAAQLDGPRAPLELLALLRAYRIEEFTIEQFGRGLVGFGAELHRRYRR